MSRNPAGGPLRFQSGGWNNPALWREQPNPAYGTPTGVQTNAQKIFGPTLGSHVNALAKGSLESLQFDVHTFISGGRGAGREVFFVQRHVAGRLGHPTSRT